MKRVFVAAFVMIICLGILSGCSAGKTFSAYEMYEQSVKVINEAGGFKAESSVEFLYPASGYSYTVSSGADVNGDNWYLRLYESDIDWQLDMYVVDGIMYLTDGYDKIRFKAGEGERAPAIEEYLPELTYELLENVEVEKNDDGFFFAIEPTVYILKAAFDGELSEFVNNEYVFANSVMTFSFDKNGIITGILYSGEVIGDFSIDETTINISAECVFTDAGTAPDVSAPADAAEYETLE